MKLTAAPVFVVIIILVMTGCSPTPEPSQLQIVINSNGGIRQLNGSKSISSPTSGLDSFSMSYVSGLSFIGVTPDPLNIGHNNQIIFTPPALPNSEGFNAGGPIDWLSLEPPSPLFTLPAVPDMYTSFVLINPQSSSLTFKSDSTTLSIAYPPKYDGTLGNSGAIYGDIQNTDGIVFSTIIPRDLGISVVDGLTTTIYLNWDFTKMLIVDDGDGRGHITKPDGSIITAEEFWDCLSISSSITPTVPPLAPVINIESGTNITWSGILNASSYNVYTVNSNGNLILIANINVTSYNGISGTTYKVAALTGTLIGSLSNALIVP